MRIVTLGQVAGVGGGDDYIYEGYAYLLRFSIESPDQFLVVQLPFIVNTLGIDPRQIMRLEVVCSGGQQAIICISFEDSACDAERLESAIDKVCAAPSAANNSYTLCNDVLRQLLLAAPAPVKARFLKDFAGTIRHKDAKSKKSEYKTHVSAGFLWRISFDAGAEPSIAEWRNAVLCCSERLRSEFKPELLERITFTAIPSSESDYRVEAELLLPKCPRIYRERSKLRFSPRPNRTTNGVATFEFVSARPEHKLKEPEKAALCKFDELETQGRLLVWNKHLSKCFT